MHPLSEGLRWKGRPWLFRHGGPVICSNGSCVLCDAFIWNRQNGHSVWRRRKNTQDESSPTKTHDKWVSNKPLSDIFHPDNCGTGSCVQMWWMCVTWWIAVYCRSACLKKQPKTNACSKWANLLGLCHCFLRLSWVSLIQTTLTLDTDCYRNADIKTSVGQHLIMSEQLTLKAGTAG